MVEITSNSPLCPRCKGTTINTDRLERHTCATCGWWASKESWALIQETKRRSEQIALIIWTIVVVAVAIGFVTMAVLDIKGATK